MTSEIDQHLGIALHRLSASAPVAVIAEHDILDLALLALVEKAGVPGVVIDLDADTPPRAPFDGAVGARPQPPVAIIRTRGRAGQVRAAAAPRSPIIVGIGAHVAAADVDEIIDSSASDSQLRRFLDRIGGTQRHVERVHVTPRESEVLTTYTLGATIRSTARQYFISESTVREHYRRVRRRYELAGRPISNKAQLLLELVEDGWVSGSATARPSADPERCPAV